jgi:hypothetical protein
LDRRELCAKQLIVKFDQVRLRSLPARSTRPRSRTSTAVPEPLRKLPRSRCAAAARFGELTKPHSPPPTPISYAACAACVRACDDQKNERCDHSRFHGRWPPRCDDSPPPRLSPASTATTRTPFVHLIIAATSSPPRCSECSTGMSPTSADTTTESPPLPSTAHTQGQPPRTAS